MIKVKKKKRDKKHKSEELKVRHLTSFLEPMEKPVEEIRKQHPNSKLEFKFYVSEVTLPEFKFSLLKL